MPQVLRSIAKEELAARAAAVPVALQEVPREAGQAHPLDAAGLAAHLAGHQLSTPPSRPPG